MDWWAEKASPSGEHRSIVVVVVVVVNAGKATSDKMPIIRSSSTDDNVVIVVAIIVGIVMVMVVRGCLLLCCLAQNSRYNTYGISASRILPLESICIGVMDRRLTVRRWAPRFGSILRFRADCS
jgi:hypothetical protein